MRRRDFVSLLASAAAWPFATHAQQPLKLPIIGYLGTATTSGPMGRRAHGEQKEAIMPQTATRGAAATLDAHTTDTSAGWERLFVGAPLDFVKLIAAIAMTGGHTNISLFNSDYLLL